MVCALATLVAVPVLLASGAGTEGVEVAAVAVPSTESAIEVDGEIEIEGLFAAGARLDDVPVVPAPEPDPQAAAVALVEAGDVSTTGLADDVITAEPQRALVDDAKSEPVDASPQTSPVESQPETTAPPSTAPPETAPAETTPPETAPPETTPPETAPPEAASEESEPEPAGEPTAEQWAALRQCEASGSYTAVNANGLYHGAYQFYQPTWNGLANLAGRSDLVDVLPSQAAPADQDALALLLWQRRGNTPWPHCGLHLPSGS